MATPESAKVAALRFANRIRKQRDLAPIKVLPKGQQGTAFSCPLARACGTNVLVTGVDLKAWSPLEVYILPPAVKRFVRLFDAGAYPELKSDDLS